MSIVAFGLGISPGVGQAQGAYAVDGVVIEMEDDLVLQLTEDFVLELDLDDHEIEVEEDHEVIYNG